MSNQPRPARAIVWLLQRISSTHAAHAAIGDIVEDLQERTSAGRRPRWPSLWLTLQVIEAAGAAARIAAPRFLRSAGHTLRDAARALRRSPWHATFIFVVLALAVSAATVTFSVVDAVVLRPLPFDQSDSIVRVMGRRTLTDWPTGLTTEQFWAVRDQVSAFESVASLGRSKTAVSAAGGATENLDVVHSTAELFQVLKLGPVIGRLWTNDEVTRGEPHVAVISSRLWRAWFGAEPAVLGRELRLDKQSYRIVGVLQPSADLTEPIGWLMDVWVPDIPPRTGPYRRGGGTIAALARLRPGVTVPQAASQVQSVVAPLASATPAPGAEWRSEVVGWQESMIGKARGWMLLALGAVALVVLIGCVNAANVMLARSLERARELAIRASLGASRRQIALSLVVESLMLSLAAGAFALLFAVWGVGAAQAALPRGLFRAATIGLNGRVFAMSILAAVATGLLFGTVPAWLASRVSIVAMLKDAGTTSTSGRSGWRRALLVAQIACISVLLVGSTLFVASFIRVVRLELGIQRSNLLAVSSNVEFNGTVDDVQDRLKATPGVVDVAVVTYTSLPLVAPVFGGAYGASQLRAADAGPPGHSVEVLVYRVTANYFDVTGMPFRRGSSWSAAAPRDAVPLVIDEIAARQLFGDRDPLGLTVRVDRLYGVFTIVGVVPFVRSQGPEKVVQPAVYVPIAPNPARKYAALFVRTSKPPADILPLVEARLAPFKPASDFPYVHLVDEAFRRLTETRRFNAALMSFFALFAMLIGAAGIYGVMASLVAQRAREIGIRIALGATSNDIRRGVIGEAGRHLALGLAGGLPIAWWISRGFGTLFFQVRPTDLSIYVTVAVLLAAVALVAAIVPARRASRVDPVVSLRAT
jgi:putative ABC transport system permease protein